MSFSSPPMGVHFYGCLPQQKDSECYSSWSSGRITIEEIGWQSYALGAADHKLNTLDFQRVIHAIGHEMHRRMQLGHGMGRCVLLIKNRWLSQLNGCVQISRKGCNQMHNYFLQRWQKLLDTCLTGGQCKENGQCTDPIDACREIELPEMRAERFVSFNLHILDRVFSFNPSNATAEQLLPLALDDKVSVEAREPSCKDETLSSTVLAIPWKTWIKTNSEGITVRITYVSNREKADIPKGNAVGNVILTGTDGFFRNYALSVANEESQVQEICDLLLELDLTALKQLQLPNRITHLIDFRNAAIQAAYLSQNAVIQAKGIQWNRDEVKRQEWKPEEEKINKVEKEMKREEEKEKSKGWWNVLFQGQPKSISPFYVRSSAQEKQE